ncbi:PREDICTED: uncharacterized protein LOC109229824 [Nicotiana attenuata]|uniref:uncharacterized protein LOC109229824 n=1 Tax=Nicotiana attenuata TaxID=49451 RepID=UPI0009048173|nr:PREDICTED: uncharacterized protein LOC109229824 [Nicotiana attenuata]
MPKTKHFQNLKKPVQSAPPSEPIDATQDMTSQLGPSFPTTLQQTPSLQATGQQTLSFQATSLPTPSFQPPVNPTPPQATSNKRAKRESSHHWTVDGIDRYIGAFTKGRTGLKPAHCFIYFMKFCNILALKANPLSHEMCRNDFDNVVNLNLCSFFVRSLLG